MRKLMFTFILIFMAGILLSSNVLATPITIFGKDINESGGLHVTDLPNSIAAQNDFLSYLEGAMVEDFEGFSNENQSTEPTDLTVDFGQAGTAVIKGGYVSGDWDLLAISNGRFSTSDIGDQFLEVRAFEVDDELIGSFTLEFEKEQSAFGFFGTDFEWSNTTFSFEAADGNITNFDIPFSDPSGGAFFFGVIDTENPFTKITFDGININNDWYGFDDFTIATKEQVVNPTPEPATFFLLGSGLALMIGLRRKKQRI